MKPTLTILIIVFISSCVHVSYLPTDDMLTYPPTNSLKIYWERPEVSYTIIGMLVAEGEGEEQLFAYIKKKAMSIGAQGIIMRMPAQQTETHGTFFYGNGTIVSDKFHRLEAIVIRFNDG